MWTTDYEVVYSSWDSRESLVDNGARRRYRLFRAIVARLLPILLISAVYVLLVCSLMSLAGGALVLANTSFVVASLSLGIMLNAILSVVVLESISDEVTCRYTKNYRYLQELEKGDLVDLKTVWSSARRLGLPFGENALSQLELLLSGDESSPIYLVGVIKSSELECVRYYLFYKNGVLATTRGCKPDVHYGEDADTHSFTYWDERDVKKSLLGKEPAIIEEIGANEYYQLDAPEGSVVYISD